MNTMILVIKGQQAGQIVEVSTEEADKAEKQGWAQKIDGRDPLNYSYPDPLREPHAESDAFLEKRFGYQTAELRPQQNPAKEAEKSDGEAAKTEEAKPKTTTRRRR